MAEWRDMTDGEKRCIETLLRATNLTDVWKIEEIIGRELDEFGSLALTMRGTLIEPNLKTSPIISAHFLDEGDEEIPVGEILLFEKDGVLTELQIYRFDSSPLRVNLDPDRIFMIRQERTPNFG
ncbi:DUF6984 family protein [Rhizobium leguminosarum]|uniref:DUF6984 family protein n=1 Tax=Rhizobium leguminosarum TaxID=384 RepID=UPI001F203D38|nr:hypothetical protein [Rhizobium leguminosarum]UIJ83194.1 hypothetical protein LZK78_32485 [Rhizobium leguminosarum]